MIDLTGRYCPLCLPVKRCGERGIGCINAATPSTGNMYTPMLSSEKVADRAHPVITRGDYGGSMATPSNITVV